MLVAVAYPESEYQEYVNPAPEPPDAVARRVVDWPLSIVVGEVIIETAEFTVTDLDTALVVVTGVDA